MLQSIKAELLCRATPGSHCLWSCSQWCKSIMFISCLQGPRWCLLA